MALFSMILFHPGPVAAGEIRLSMAASLKEVITELSDVFSKNTPGITFQRNSGASGALAKQIESGAPADIFFSANMEWMDYLKDKGLIEKGNTAILALNELVFVGRSSLKVNRLEDVADLEKIAVASPKSAPAGQYAMEALTKAGIDKKLDKKLVMAKDVRESLMYAERGEVDGSFVYKTDAGMMSERLKILFTVPESLCPKAIYAMGLTKEGSGKSGACEFFRFLQSSDAKKILVKYGFIVE